MLSGVHDRELRMKVGIAIQLIARERALEIVMQEVFPNLCQWWVLFRCQTGTLAVEIPPQVQVQYDESQAWLQNLLSPKVIVCPYCQGQNCYLSKLQKNQAGYRCNPCQRKFSILAPTRFRTTQRTSELQYIFNLILNGACNADIVITHGISEQRIKKWRAKLMAQLQDLNLKLAY